MKLRSVIWQLRIQLTNIKYKTKKKKAQKNFFFIVCNNKKPYSFFLVLFKVRSNNSFKFFQFITTVFRRWKGRRGGNSNKWESNTSVCLLILTYTVRPHHKNLQSRCRYVKTHIHIKCATKSLLFCYISIVNPKISVYRDVAYRCLLFSSIFFLIKLKCKTLTEHQFWQFIFASDTTVRIL